MKKQLKSIFAVLGLLVLVLSVGFALLFSLVGKDGGFFGFSTWDNAGLGSYIAVKVLVSLALIAVIVVFLSSKKQQEGISTVVLSFTLGLQLLPLFSRGFAQLARHVNATRDWAWVIALVIELLVIVFYVALVLLLTLSKRRMLEIKEAVKPAEVAVQSAQSVFDENGDFKGPRS